MWKRKHKIQMEQIKKFEQRLADAKVWGDKEEAKEYARKLDELKGDLVLWYVNIYEQENNTKWRKCGYHIFDNELTARQYADDYGTRHPEFIVRVDQSRTNAWKVKIFDPITSSVLAMTDMKFFASEFDAKDYAERYQKEHPNASIRIEA